MSEQQRCFALLLAYEAQKGVETKRPNGERVHVQYLVEEYYGDVDRVLGLIELAEPPRHRVGIESIDGILLRGRLLLLSDVGGGAIENGYLEALGDHLTTEGRSQ